MKNRITTVIFVRNKDSNIWRIDSTYAGKKNKIFEAQLKKLLERMSDDLLFLEGGA